MQVLAFELDGLTYALPLGRVREVVRAVAVRALPGAPPIVEGVIDLRGTPVPVLNVRDRFGHPPRPLHPNQHMIIATAAGRPVVLLVDRTIGIEEVQAEGLDPRPGCDRGSRYVEGVTRIQDEVALIHDLDTFLSSAEADALDAAATGHG